MKLSKATFDVGLFTTQADKMRSFWEREVGAIYQNSIKIAEGHDQHRYDLNGSLIKINAVASLEDEQATSFSELLVARASVAGPTSLQDCDGNRITIVPMGHEGVEQLGLRLNVEDLERSRTFLRDALGKAETRPEHFAIGRGSLLLSGGGQARPGAAFRGVGYRYLALETEDILADHAMLVERGARPGAGVQQMGNIVRFALLQDPEGNWLEVVQRAAPGEAFGPLNG